MVAKSDKIKLLQITHDLDLGGLQQVVVNICKTVNRDLFDVTVLCLRNLGVFVPELEKIGVEVVLLPQRKGGADYFSFLKVARFLRERQIDVIHSHNTQPFVDGVLGAIFSGVKTVVHTDHARDFPDKRRYMIAERIVSHFAYRVVGVSEHTSENLKIYEKVSPRKLVTIPNGIDGSRFTVKTDKHEMRRQLGINPDGPIIGLGVRLTEQKGITYLLEAMPIIIQSFPNITLLIAGEGPLENDLKRQTQSLGITNHVKFLGLRLDIPQLLQLFDLYVLPSKWEGLPMVLIEAMAAGCPIVSTDVGGISMAIQSGVNGSLVGSKNSALLAAEVNRLLMDKSLRKTYAENGLNVFRKRYSAEIMTSKYEQLYLRQT